MTVARGTIRLATLAAILLCFVGGCGRNPGTSQTTIRGSVFYQGRPLAGGMIVFAPDHERGTPGKSISATIGQDGSYSVTPEKSAAGGWYRIAFAEAAEESQSYTGENRLPLALRRPDKSGVDREVSAGKDNVMVFDIEVPR